MDLTGAWRAVEADEDLRRAYPDPDFDDSAWGTVEVPGHWRTSPDFADSDGPLLHRLAFAGGGAVVEGRRSWLVFDGVFYQTDVWLDGSYVGDTEGYFYPHEFEVTSALAERSEHVLAVEVACSRPRDLTAKRNITGVFQHADFIDPEWNPGGIWRGVRIEETGPVRIKRLRTLVTEASAERAVVTFRALLDAASACTVRMRTVVGGVEHEQEQPVAAGENRFSWKVFVEGPELWWPWSLGPQPMTDVSVSVFVGEEIAPSDVRTLQTGLRQVRMDDFILAVNGERLFLKGSNQGPTRMELALAEPADFERDVLLARDAGLDLLRLDAHISRPELYDAADRHGMLLWQDFPLQWGYARGIRKQAAHQAREAVDMLGHHPSIAVWCGHNEPVPVETQPSILKQALSHQLPRWNKTLLDSSVRRAFERSDSSRPVVPHSGVLPGVVRGGTDSHLYFGWLHGSYRDLPGFLGAWPRLARFVSEFGAQAVPSGSLPWLDDSQWPHLDWEYLARKHGLQKDRFDVYVPPGEYATFDEWRHATQRYQAELIRRCVETVRRLKYRPSGGFCQFALADSWQGVTWSVLGIDRTPKMGYDALAAACAPVIVVADQLPAVVRRGDALGLDVHVVSDLRVPVEGGRVHAVLTWPGGSEEWAFEGSVPPDECVRVKTLQFVVPNDAGAGEVVLDLELNAEDGIKASNRYTAVIG